jgi:diguanylate cyclase
MQSLERPLPNGLLAQMSSAVSTAHTVEQLTRPLLELLELVTGLESTYLTHIDLQRGVQEVLYARNSQQMEIPEGGIFPWEDTLCQRALAERRFYTDEVNLCWGESDAARLLGIRTYLSAPVMMEGGEIFGTLCGASKQKQPVSAQGQHILSLFAALIAQYVQRERLLEQLQRANAALENYSFTDALTGLPNRRFILAELERLFAQGKRHGQQVMVAFIDLDGFKKINDTYGHDTGDEFLQAIAQRLRDGIRHGDIAGRLGGDEFVVAGLIDGQTEPQKSVAEATRGRLAPLIAGDYALRNATFCYPGGSFGILCLDPAIYSAEQALVEADAAMYRDKKARRAAAE